MSEVDLDIIEARMRWNCCVDEFGHGVLVDVREFIKDLQKKGYEIVKRNDDNAKD